MTTIEMNDAAGQAAALAQARSLGYTGSDNMNSVASWFVDRGYRVHFANQYFGSEPAPAPTPVPATTAPATTTQSFSVTKVVINGNTDADIVVQYNLGGYEAAGRLSDMSATHQAVVRSWMQTHTVIDQRNDYEVADQPAPSVPAPILVDSTGQPTTTVSTATTVADIPTNLLNIDPPMGSFEETRQYLKQFQNWQAVTVRNGSTVSYVYDGGLCDVNGKFFSGYGGYSAPSGSRPGGAYNGPIPSDGSRSITGTGAVTEIVPAEQVTPVTEATSTDPVKTTNPEPYNPITNPGGDYYPFRVARRLAAAVLRDLRVKELARKGLRLLKRILERIRF